jgi:hypothetical protein
MYEFEIGTYFERGEEPAYADPIHNDILDDELATFVGPIAKYRVVDGRNAPFCLAYRRPLSTSDIDDIEEVTDGSVTGPLGAALEATA